MNWLSTDAQRSQRNHLPLFACLILACALPLVSCQIEEQGFRADPKNIRQGDVTSRHNEIQWSYPKKKSHPVGEHIAEGKHWDVGGHIKEGRKPMKHHGKHKKRFRGKNKAHRNSQPNEVESKKIHLNYVESEKKYFDYFPAKDSQEKFEPLRDDSVETVLVLNVDDIEEKEKASGKSTEGEIDQKFRRFKREIPDQETNSGANYNYVRNFLATEQGIKPPQVTAEGKVNENNEYYSYGTPNDPWNNRFTRPVNSFYLPVPRAFVPSFGPYIKYPIPGIYYNPVSPPGIFSIIRRVGGRPSLQNRFGDEGEEDRVIWEIKYTGNGGTVLRPGTQPSRPSTTRKPPPPLIHIAKRNETSRASTTTPQRPRVSISQRPPGSISQQPPTLQSNVIPQSVNTRPTQAPVRTEPSKCVWAIVTCCARNNLSVRYNCFEQIGCHGAFWDFNPCADQLQDAALKEAETFFN